MPKWYHIDDTILRRRHTMAMKEREAISSSGWLAILLGLTALGAAIWVVAGIVQLEQRAPQPVPLARLLGGVALVLAGLIVLRGIFIVSPNEARVLTFFGTYTGTVRAQGLRWANPFTVKRALSLRARNFETAKIKVNDIDGNPIEIGAVIVWRIVDTAQ